LAILPNGYAGWGLGRGFAVRDTIPEKVNLA